MTASEIPFPTFASDPPAPTASAEFIRLCPWRVGFALFGVATLLGLIDATLWYFVAPHEREPRIAYVLAVTFPQWYVLVPLVPAALKAADRFPLAPGRWRRSLLVHVPACAAFVVANLALASFLCDFVLAPMVTPGEKSEPPAPMRKPSYFASVRRPGEMVDTYLGNRTTAMGTPCVTATSLPPGDSRSLSYLRRRK